MLRDGDNWLKKIYIEKIKGTKKCLIYTESGNEYEISGSVKEILEMLDESFVLSHKSCIINMNKVKYVDIQNGTITFVNEEELDKLSFRQKKDFEKNILKK